MKLKAIFLGVFLLLAVTSPASAQSVVTNSEFGFQLELQKGWDELASREDFKNTYLRVASPEGIKAAALYVQVFEREGYSLATYQQAVRRYVKESMKGTVIRDEELPVNGLTVWRIEYAGESKGYTEDRRHFMNTVAFRDSQIFVVHCATEEETWEKFRPDLEAMSSSLRFTDR